VPVGLTAVIFDLDGVLVDSFQVMRQAFSVAYSEIVGLQDAPFDEYRRHMGMYFPEIMRAMGLPAELEGPFVRESRRLSNQVTVYAGVQEMLLALRDSGLRLAIATGKSGSRARSLLETVGLLGDFDSVIGSDEVAAPKPAPDIILRALERLGAEARDAIMVGDAPVDLQSAHAAGVFAAAALWGEADPAQLQLSIPDAILDRPADVVALCLPRP